MLPQFDLLLNMESRVQHLQPAKCTRVRCSNSPLEIPKSEPYKNVVAFTNMAGKLTMTTHISRMTNLEKPLVSKNLKQPQL